MKNIYDIIKAVDTLGYLLPSVAHTYMCNIGLQDKGHLIFDIKFDQEAVSFKLKYSHSKNFDEVVLPLTKKRRAFR